MSFQAVIFDMDGLLTDSESIGLDVIHDQGFQQGVDIPLDLIRETLGADDASAAQMYHRFYPDLDTDRLFRDFRDAMHALAKEGKIPLKKGAVELLNALKARNIPCAVASSSSLDTIELYLSKVNVLSYFSALVTGAAEDIPSKPAPDIFLRAAAALGAEPEKCLVLEDSVHGVQAGRAAGMTVVMVPDMIPYSEGLAPYVDHVLPDLSAVIPLLDA